jgi:hypothetical protein
MEFQPGCSVKLWVTVDAAEAIEENAVPQRSVTQKSFVQFH